MYIYIHINEYINIYIYIYLAEMQKRKRPILCYSEFRAKALVRQTITHCSSSIAMLLYLPYCYIAILLYCHIAILPYCYIAILTSHLHCIFEIFAIVISISPLPH